MASVDNTIVKHLLHPYEILLAHLTCSLKFKYMKNNVPKQELLAGNFPARLNFKGIDLQTSPTKFPALLAYTVKLKQILH